MIRATCPNCQDTVSFADHLGGFTVRCPACRVAMDVPRTTSLASASANDGPEITTFPAPETVSPPAEPEVPVDVTRRLHELRRRPIWPWAVLLGLPPTMAGLAWLTEGASVWQGALYLAVAVAALITFVAVRETLVHIRHQRPEWWGVALLLYLWVLVGVWYGVGILAQRGEIHVDNESAQLVTIEVDGKTWLDAARGAQIVSSLRRGSHHLTLRSKLGEVVQELDVEVEGQKVYILNVLGAQTYYRGRLQYGGLSLFNVRTEPEKITSPWFEAKADFLFQDPPSKITVQVPRGVPAGLSSESRIWLRRGSPLPER